ncbi:MAG: DUF1028 domain-containing protein [Saprospiraceae bacterium]
MRKVFTACFLFLCANLISQDTFSIVAIDTITGEIGSAGASCLDNNSFPGSGGAIIISDILPGRGAIHTQSFWLAQNQANARVKMEEGLSAAEIIDWLSHNDAEGQFGEWKRQYGIVDLDLDGHPRSASYTGISCYDYKGHKNGVNYAIQGNILLGAQILDSIESHFLNSSGTLADRLMYALQGANVPGADSRCLNNGTSSLSAFLRVARPDDQDDNLFLDLNVPSLPTGMEPIDSLQRLYDNWKATLGNENFEPFQVKIFPNPANGYFNLLWEGDEGKLQIFNLNSQFIFEQHLKTGLNTFSPNLSEGIYLIQVVSAGSALLNRKLVWQNP